MSSCLKRHYEKELDKVDLSVRGWNWGVADFVGECFYIYFSVVNMSIIEEDSLDFRVHGKTAFEIPLRCVSRAVAGTSDKTAANINIFVKCQAKTNAPWSSILTKNRQSVWLKCGFTFRTRMMQTLTLLT